NLLGPEAFGGEFHTLTSMTMRGFSNRIPTIMTTNLTLLLVISQTHVTIRALRNVPTSHTLQNRSKSSSVLEQNHLLSVFECCCDFLQKRVTKVTCHLLTEVFVFQIDNFNFRKLGFAETLRELNQTKLLIFRIEKRFDTWGSTS